MTYSNIYEKLFFPKYECVSQYLGREDCEIRVHSKWIHLYKVQNKAKWSMVWEELKLTFFSFKK